LVQAQQLSLSTMRCAPSRTAKEALRGASAIADAIAFAIGQPPKVDVNEIIVRTGRKHVLITRSRLAERPVDRKSAACLRPFCCGAAGNRTRCINGADLREHSI
jgi:hypothetical protein